jgi:hypothetical protein
VADFVADLGARDEPCLAVGDGARRYAAALASVDGVEIGWPSEAYPSASTLAELAYPRARQGDVATPTAVGALYLRTADTRVRWEGRHPHPIDQEPADVRIAPGRGR